MGSITEHLDVAKQQQVDFLRPKTVQEPFAAYVATWIGGLHDDEFDKARCDMNSLIAENERHSG